MNLKGKLACVGVSDAGRIREHNEDTIGTDAAIGLVVLADGMGGYKAGEVASGIAVRTVMEIAASELWGTAACDSITWTRAERSIVWDLRLPRVATNDGAGSPLGLLVLFALTLMLFFNLAYNVRQAFWDMGKGYEPETRMKMAKFTLIGSVSLTVLVWVVALALR